MDLKARFRRFALSMSDAECIDSIDHTSFTAQKADYFFFRRSIVAEVKVLTEDRGKTINEKLNELANSDPTFPQFFGEVHVEEIIQAHRNSDSFRRWICDYAARRLSELVRSADHQIHDTKRALQLPSSAGVLILLNEGIQLYDDDFVYQEVSRLLNRKRGGAYERNNIHAVWYINEYRAEERRVSSSAFIGPSAINNHLSDLLNMLHLHWASENGYAIQLE